MTKPFAITLDVGSSLANHTGAWRQERPVYVDLTPPCAHACPAMEDPQKWLYAAEDGSYEQAWRTLVEANPFPAIMGRVCYHPCETACNRSFLDEAVGINAVERFLGDHAIEQGWTLPVPAVTTGRRVLVVGAGPTGLSAAYQLRRLGHEVTVRDSSPKPGGMMRYGIPAYRLPRDVLDAEIARIIDLGITLELGRRVDDVLAAMAEGFDAVFLAVGAQIGKRAYVPAGEAARIVDAVSMLHDVAQAEPPMLGRRVVVYGGGNTAVDAARTAKRLGATDSIIVYRRTRDRMPAHDSEMAEALEEGVVVKWLSTVAHADAGHLRVERMELDDSGFPQPTGEFEDLEADSLVLALGQESDLSLVDGVADLALSDGSVQVDSTFMTGHPGIFAGGDVVPAQRTVTVGVGHGARAARAIDAWLRRAAAVEPTEAPLAEYSSLNTWYYADAPHAVRPRLEAARRTSGFEEVVQGLDAETAAYEARRCMSCGNCFECDNCYGVCPDNAVIKLGPGMRFAIDYDYCKGCGICVAECPSGSILMVPEPR
ncbi:NAD(P)-binding protein [Cellulomonas humilata]|uniref:2-oxoacid:acceptor oxidoreductase delta subunit (Pyruvate/2-ketoisovalerate family) n=1 Tax=Cellulomonas humilata TaxID=144055 RepID=A0ABU0EH56_9CELL|nr:NAD(P)-binding protein [Cellulomonas humilata]MDQ0374613.1 2-oxoacid:acceptor oxidoreductase delta subunit (pyruvate/2-ketoisovalerate family) [Cellulomonas humilata]